LPKSRCCGWPRAWRSAANIHWLPRSSAARVSARSPRRRLWISSPSRGRASKVSWTENNSRSATRRCFRISASGRTRSPLRARRREGQTVMALVVDGAVAGLIGVADPIKGSTLEALRQLRAEGIRIVMLTGDSRATAEAVARQLGITEIHAEVLPDQKLAIVEKLQAEGHVVAMAGDGINDAPALA